MKISSKYKKKLLVLIVLRVFLFIGLGYSLIESSLGISGALSFLSPHVTLTLDANGGSANYFLVRRSYKYDNSDGSFAFDIYSMSTSDNFSRTPARYYTTSDGWKDNGSSFGVRLIITLDSSVTASSNGSGTKTDPYILN